METQFERKPPLPSSQSSIFIIKKNSYNMYWCRLIPARRHPPAEGYNLLSFTSLSWKGEITPCSRLLASPGRELLPPNFSTSLYWQKASTFRLKASTLRSTTEHVSSIFKLNQTASTQFFTYQQTSFFIPSNRTVKPL